MGNFIISLDCEGKWGMADKISASHDVITETSLNKVYVDLLRLFEKYQIKATFAFVGMFTLTEAERKRYHDLAQDVLFNGENWFKYYREAEATGDFSGWFCPDAWERVKNSEHEIASHGFSHVPYTEGKATKESLQHDVDSALLIARDKGVDISTFIYPRNLVGYQTILQKAGVLGYRDYLPYNGKARSLLSELNVAQGSQPDIEDIAGLQRIPSGFFFNWREGMRKRIPKSVTRLRWKRIIDDAAKSDETAHLWLHPHNLITAPETMEVLDNVLEYASQKRDMGDLRSVTQDEYIANRRLSSN